MLAGNGRGIGLVMGMLSAVGSRESMKPLHLAIPLKSLTAIHEDTNQNGLTDLIARRWLSIDRHRGEIEGS